MGGFQKISQFFTGGDFFARKKSPREKAQLFLATIESFPSGNSQVEKNLFFSTSDSEQMPYWRLPSCGCLLFSYKQIRCC